MEKKMENATKQRKNGTKDEKKDGKAGKNTMPIKNPKCLSAYYINVATDKCVFHNLIFSPLSRLKIKPNSTKTYKKMNKCLSPHYINVATTFPFLP